MSKTILEPAGDHVIVADNRRETTIDGISMPDNMRQQEMVFGLVVNPGPEAVHTKAEDLVCYGPYAGKTIVIEGVELRLLREGQIEGYLRRVD